MRHVHSGSFAFCLAQDLFPTLTHNLRSSQHKSLSFSKWRTHLVKEKVLRSRFWLLRFFYYTKLTSHPRPFSNSPNYTGVGHTDLLS